MRNYKLTYNRILIYPPVEDHDAATRALRRELLEQGIATVGMAIDGEQFAPAQITVGAEDEASATTLGL